MKHSLDSESRSLGLVSATTVVAASMIGAGVYTTSGFTIGSLGSSWWVILAWIIGGLVATCGAISYAALATRFTQSGGEYLLLSRTLHPIAGLMAGWVSLLAGFTAPIAVAALALESYLLPIVGERQLFGQSGLIAIAVILLAAVLHTLSVRPSARVQDVVVGLKLVMIGAFVVAALLTNAGGWRGWTPLPPVDEFSVSAFAVSLLYISFSYAGFNAAIYFAGEVSNPRRNVPLAIIGGTLLVTMIYIVLNAIFVLAPDKASIANQEQIATIAAGVIAGPSFATFVRVVIVVSLFTSVSALVMTGPRVYAKMADDGFLPQWFRFRGRPPAFAIWFQSLASILVVCIATLQTLLSYLGFTLSLCSALTICMVFRLRADRASIRLPGYPFPPLIFVLATFATAIIAAVREPRQAIAAVLTIGLGAVLYPIVYKRRRRLRDRRAG